MSNIFRRYISICCCRPFSMKNRTAELRWNRILLWQTFQHEKQNGWDLHKGEARHPSLVGTCFFYQKRIFDKKNDKVRKIRQFGKCRISGSGNFFWKTSGIRQDKLNMAQPYFFKTFSVLFSLVDCLSRKCPKASMFKTSVIKIKHFLPSYCCSK